jgi:cell division protein ZapE
MANSITARYAAGVAGGKVEQDDAQVAVVRMLARLEERIVEHRLARKSSSLGWLFAGRKKEEAPLKGLYV